MMKQSTALLTFADVGFHKRERIILKDISFSVKKGEILTIIGPNGAGKSTIAKLALNLLTPTTGTVTRLPGCKIGYVPQKLFFDHTIPMTVSYFINLIHPKPTKESIQDTLAEVRADYLLDQSIHRLSGGELQRVLLGTCTK